MITFLLIKKRSHFEPKIERSEIRRSLGVGGQSQIKPKRVAPSSRRFVGAFYKTNPKSKRSEDPDIHQKTKRTQNLSNL